LLILPKKLVINLLSSPFIVVLGWGFIVAFPMALTIKLAFYQKKVRTSLYTEVLLYKIASFVFVFLQVCFWKFKECFIVFLI
jgi:hypothetical protein